MSARRFLLPTLLVAATAIAGSARADASRTDAVARGALLYENHCVECHTDDVHFRAKRLVRRRDDVLDQVARWQDYLELGWTLEEMRDVAAYLDRRYYGFGEEKSK